MASKVSDLTFGKHTYRQKAHTAHVWKEQESGKLEGKGTALFKRVKCCYILPKEFEFSNDEFNEEVEMVHEGGKTVVKVVAAPNTPNDVVACVTYTKQSIDMNGEEDHNKLDEYMEYSAEYNAKFK